MASRGGRKRKRDHFEDSIDRIHETLKAPNLGDRSEYTRNLSIYLKAMDDLQPLLLGKSQFFLQSFRLYQI